MHSSLSEIAHILVDVMVTEKICLLEVILISLMIVAKEWDRVGHHPDVSSPTVVVRVVPLPVLVANGEDLLLHHRHGAGVEDLLMKT